MSISIKTPQEIEKMRIAGRLAGEVLDYITPFVQAGITTDEIDKLCHDYTVNVQGGIPAPLNYAPGGHTPYPKSICTSINHQVCHGIPSDKKLKNGDIVNIDVTPIKDGYHGDSSRMYYVGEPSIQAKRLCETTLCGDVARYPHGQAGRDIWVTSVTPSRLLSKGWVTAWYVNSAGTVSAASSTKNRRYCTTASRIPE